jgi:hypothetical protein
MKAPQNFAEKVKGYTLTSGFYKYGLGDTNGRNDMLWIYPKANSPNVIMLEFDWSKHTYNICVARGGDGINFHTTNEGNSFNPQYFRTFDLFIEWLRLKVADWWHYFGY